jgi:hypothetical protein
MRMHVDRERVRYNYRRSIWLLAWHCLNGARRFDVFDPLTGRLSPTIWTVKETWSSSRRISFPSSTAPWRALPLWTSAPKIMRQGTSLRMIRERSSAQIIADSLVSDHQLSQVTSDFAHIFATLGCCGIHGAPRRCAHRRPYCRS